MTDYTDKDVRDTIDTAAKLFHALGMERHEKIMCSVEAMAELLLREGMGAGLAPASAPVIPIDRGRISQRLATGDDGSSA